jgi:hypothetical protein
MMICLVNNWPIDFFGWLFKAILSSLVRLVGHPKSVRVRDGQRLVFSAIREKNPTKSTMRAAQNDVQVKFYQCTSGFL